MTLAFFKKLRRRLIELQSADTHFYVPVVLSGPKSSVPVKMLLDTGSTKVVLPREFADALGLKALGLDRDVAVATGATDLATTIIPSIQIRGSILIANNVEAWIEDNLLLGMSFLSRFKFRISYGRRLLIEN